MMESKIGFARQDITPPPGIELGGYAGYRPCSGCHDPLWCKAVVIEQAAQRFAFLVFDLLCVDESLSRHLQDAAKQLGIDALIAAAIHSHAAPCGIVLGEGPLALVNQVSESNPEDFRQYTDSIIAKAMAACQDACTQLEPFEVRAARGPAPVIGSERHTSEPTNSDMTAIQIQTESGRSLILYQIPCHPTVLGPENLLSSADFTAGIESRLDCDMAVFFNGAAGDISTRFTRREQTFAECDRIAEIAANAVMDLIRSIPYGAEKEVKGLHTHVTLQPRPVEPMEKARQTLENAVACWNAGVEAGMSPTEIRLLKTHVEGAGVALEFSRTMEGIQELHLPVTVFSFAGLQFATVPGEIFSRLWQLDAVPICYADGYYRYIANSTAYELGYYEAMAAIIAEGQGEVFMEHTAQLLKQL